MVEKQNDKFIELTVGKTVYLVKGIKLNDKAIITFYTTTEGKIEPFNMYIYEGYELEKARQDAISHFLKHEGKTGYLIELKRKE